MTSLPLPTPPGSATQPGVGGGVRMTLLVPSLLCFILPSVLSGGGSGLLVGLAKVSMPTISGLLVRAKCGRPAEQLRGGSQKQTNYIWAFDQN